jgi:site-specific recombinase XerD
MSRILRPGLHQARVILPEACWRLDIRAAKGGRKRAVPIPPELVEPLRQHLASHDAERQAAGDAWDDRDLVWCGPEGQPIDPHDDWEQWKALLAEAGITKDARLHDARHTAGTLLGEQHVDMHVIQQFSATHKSPPPGSTPSPPIN